MSTTHNDYLNKKNKLIVLRVNKNTLEKLKMLYEDDINSNRRLSTIDSVGDLIEVLEKRACVSDKNITILENIAKEINFPLTTAPQSSVISKPVIGKYYLY